MMLNSDHCKGATNFQFNFRFLWGFFFGGGVFCFVFVFAFFVSLFVFCCCFFCLFCYIVALFSAVLLNYHRSHLPVYTATLLYGTCRNRESRFMSASVVIISVLTSLRSDRRMVLILLWSISYLINIFIF